MSPVCFFCWRRGGQGWGGEKRNARLRILRTQVVDYTLLFTLHRHTSHVTYIRTTSPDFCARSVSKSISLEDDGVCAFTTIDSRTTTVDIVVSEAVAFCFGYEAFSVRERTFLRTRKSRWVCLHVCVCFTRRNYTTNKNQQKTLGWKQGCVWCTGLYCWQNTGSWRSLVLQRYTIHQRESF